MLNAGKRGVLVRPYHENLAVIGEYSTYHGLFISAEGRKQGAHHPLYVHF